MMPVSGWIRKQHQNTHDNDYDTGKHAYPGVPYKAIQRVIGQPDAQQGRQGTQPEASISSPPSAPEPLASASASTA